MSPRRFSRCHSGQASSQASNSGLPSVMLSAASRSFCTFLLWMSTGAPNDSSTADTGRSSSSRSAISYSRNTLTSSAVGRLASSAATKSCTMPSRMAPRPTRRSARASPRACTIWLTSSSWLSAQIGLSWHASTESTMRITISSREMWSLASARSTPSTRILTSSSDRLKSAPIRSLFRKRSTLALYAGSISLSSGTSEQP
mmetsp:Transcript_17073/g.43296  ORF Transcript_17073/g.43296 Transcript_17073/m.43296 type:complete len:201 (-) Transcript_17073:92-694(-)